MTWLVSGNKSSCMGRDSRLSDVLHALLHMAQQDAPSTSDEMAKAMKTNPVVVRRTRAGLREHGYVRSERDTAVAGRGAAIPQRSRCATSMPPSATPRSCSRKPHRVARLPGGSRGQQSPGHVARGRGGVATRVPLRDHAGDARRGCRRVGCHSRSCASPRETPCLAPRLRSIPSRVILGAIRLSSRKARTRSSTGS